MIGLKKVYAKHVIEAVAPNLKQKNVSSTARIRMTVDPFVGYVDDIFCVD